MLSKASQEAGNNSSLCEHAPKILKDVAAHTKVRVDSTFTSKHALQILLASSFFLLRFPMTTSQKRAAEQQPPDTARPSNNGKDQKGGEKGQSILQEAKGRGARANK
jgi:hypothetical protein